MVPVEHGGAVITTEHDEEGGGGGDWGCPGLAVAPGKISNVALSPSFKVQSVVFSHESSEIGLSKTCFVNIVTMHSDQISHVNGCFWALCPRLPPHLAKGLL